MDDRADVSSKSFGDQEQRYMKTLSMWIATKLIVNMFLIDELETLHKSYSKLLNGYLEQENELSDQCLEKQAIVEQA